MAENFRVELVNVLLKISSASEVSGITPIHQVKRLVYLNFWGTFRYASVNAVIIRPNLGKNYCDSKFQFSCQYLQFGKLIDTI